MSTLYRQRRLLGVCGQCGKIPTGVMARCPRCLAMIASYRKPPSDESRAAARAYGRKQRLKDPTRDWRYRLTLKYGITPERYHEMLHEQNGGCAVCDTKFGEAARGKRLFVDHDHRTGEVRGLLCGRCNAAIGFLMDNPSRLNRMAEYLKGVRSLA